MVTTSYLSNIKQDTWCVFPWQEPSQEPPQEPSDVLEKAETLAVLPLDKPELMLMYSVLNISFFTSIFQCIHWDWSKNQVITGDPSVVWIAR